MDQLIQGDEEVTDWVRQSRTIRTVTRVPGDASARRYYRIEATDGNSYIVMWVEPFAGQEKEMPFLVVQAHLKKSGIWVPQVFDVDGGRGFVLLEDLGDVMLLRKLQGTDDVFQERFFYERAIDALVQLQLQASPAAHDQSLEAFRLSFDQEKLMWEVNFAIENFYEIYLKRVFAGTDRQIIVDGFSEICTTLAAQPRVLTHRDYHSRNIMIKGDGSQERFFMIDFQDARMGPAQYDLASLLRDSYYQLEEVQITALLEYYIKSFESKSGKKLDRLEFLEIFDLMSIQRNFKAIGSFASFLNRRGDASYLKYIGNTFENIRRTLLKYPRYAHLRELLFHYYYF